MTSLRHVFRRLGRAPGFTTIALLTLALGIGANTAIFSVVNGVLLKPLPYPESEGLIGVRHVAPGIPAFGSTLSSSPTMYFTYREQTRAFQDFGVWSTTGVSVMQVAQPEQLFAINVTHGVLDALRVTPAMGRIFSDADMRPGAPQTVMLSYGYWQSLGSDPNMVGRTLNVDNRLRTIVGVLPQDFRFFTSVAPRVFLPLQFEREKLTLGDFSYQGIARLKAGVSLEQANQDVARMLPTWLGQWPMPYGMSTSFLKFARFGPKLEPLKDEVVGDVGDSLWVLMAAIGVLLLIACANIANLLLVRAEGRQQELAVRAALGAGWGNIAREMLLESLVLGLGGGVLGVILADTAVRVLVAVGPGSIPRLAEIGVDVPVLVFALGVSLLSAIVFGLAPVLKYGAPSVAAALRGGGRSTTSSRERHRSRGLLVVLQVALAVVLLVGAGLMIRTFAAIRSIDPGFTHPEQIQMVSVPLPPALIAEPERVERIEEAMRQRLAAIPGVQAAAFAASVPLDGNSGSDLFVFRDKPPTQGQIPATRRIRYVSPGFLGVFGTPLLAGRDFGWHDMRADRAVAMISRNLAVEIFGTPQAALGRMMQESPTEPGIEIVGVVGDVRDNSLTESPMTTVYLPVLTLPIEYRPGVVRTAKFVIQSSRTGTEGFVKEVREAIGSVQSGLPIFGVRTMAELYDQSLARTSFTLVLLGIASAMALLLGVIGIYGVVAYAVTQRTREIGIRAALGAEAGSLKMMFVRQGIVLASIGIAVGLAAAAALSRGMQAVLFGVKPLDPMTFVAVPMVLALAVIAASYLPARRATRVSPIQALRTE